MRPSPVAWIVAAVALSAPVRTIPAQDTGRELPLRGDRRFDRIVAAYRTAIPGRMAEEEVPGLAIAVVDRHGVLWAEGFGSIDRARTRPVDTGTTFSLQSTSKMLTALGVLVAVRDGDVGLDEPITSYLPEFSVQSRWETAPAQRMTLRHLLSHRAGFTHEAPIGNNYVAAFPSFEEHIRSIASTWLRYPVGARHSYANLGIDLAGHLLSEVTGMPFQEYMRVHVLAPLGMPASSFDWSVVRAAENRARGHVAGYEDVPLEFAMIPSGGLYSNIQDMAALIRFHLTGMTAAGRPLLPDSIGNEMYAIQFPVEGQIEGYGLGLRRLVRYGSPHFNHNGAGFGFQSHVSWYPAFGFGIVVLTNAMDHNLTNRLPREIVEGILEAFLGSVPQPVQAFRALAGRPVDHRFKQRFVGTFVGRNAELTFQLRHDTLGVALGRLGFVELQFVSDSEAYADVGPDRWLLRFTFQGDGIPSHVTRANDGTTYDYYFGPNDLPQTPQPTWSAYTGTYGIRLWGRVVAEMVVEVRDGRLLLNNAPLAEFQPGLFFTPGGEAVDFRGPTPTMRNISLERR